MNRQPGRTTYRRMNQNERINDELLVIRAQEGAVEALSELIQRWQDRLWRLAWRLTDDEQAAWDVLQEAWIVISRRIRRLDDPAAFPAWAYRITTPKDWDVRLLDPKGHEMPLETMITGNQARHAVRFTDSVYEEGRLRYTEV